MTLNHSWIDTYTGGAIVFTIGYTLFMLTIKLLHCVDFLPWIIVLIPLATLLLMIVVILILFLIGALIHKFK